MDSSFLIFKNSLENDFLTIEKAFVNNKPLTIYIITEFGRAQFKEYVELLESLFLSAF
ncbi:MAG: transcriptional regulator [Pseudobutyrivibrio sp.]|nr:transcriptional regulator [Pseudobutyrivibrio sp.]